ncbi:MAG: DegT/DnrJ/EryC1/StrS family aminotransferase [bacterium]
MEKRNVPIFRVYHTPAMEVRALEVLRSGAIAVGSYNERFSCAFGELIERPHVVTTNDMSSAIQIALRLAGVGEGDEVLTTPFACMSTNAPIATSGARPVWVDVDPHTATIDLDSMRRAVTSRCKALLLYHVAGYPGPVEEVKAFCDEYGIVLIEDCDNALLATVHGKQVGQWGRFSIYSFYPNRQINASEGGALACSDPRDAERAIRLRRLGIDLRAFRGADGEIDPACDIPEVGWASTLNNLCSALAFEQVATVAERVAAARRNARFYDEAFAGSRSISSVDPLPGAAPSYWSYLIRAAHRDELIATLKHVGVGASKHHYLNMRYSGFKVKAPELPGSSELMDSIFAIPCGWWLTAEDLGFVASMITSF